ncbi:MAG: PD-(D/E)XK nuclease family protein [Kiritimatiellia bacterium]
MTATIKVPDICERDIDLLLLEEVVASSDFRSWFLSQIGIKEHISLIEASRSVKTANGESDLELTIKVAGGAIRVLVENKVDAAFQPNQPERYTDRANEYEKSGKYQRVVTVVIAPKVYFSDDAENIGFDVRLTYESVLAWFVDANQLGTRRDYKLALIRGAIERGRLGWKLVPNENVGKFWQKYWQMAEQFAPQLAMPVPKKKIPADSHFIRFRPAGLPASVSLWHKVGYGNVDLQFSGMGDKLAEMERRYRAFLIPPMRIEQAAKSAVIRIRVPPVNMTSAIFSDCKDTMRKGLETAVTLLEWYDRLGAETRRNVKANGG